MIPWPLVPTRFVWQVASTFAAASLDPATQRVRALLRDSIGVIAVRVPADSAALRAAITVRAEGDDPIAATALLLGDSVARAGTVIERRAAVPTAELTQAAERGATVVHWPARVATGEPVLQAVTVDGATWIAPMQRDSAAAPEGTRAIGWWADGTPAVWRRDVGRGCVLTTAIALPRAGDHTLSLAAQAFVQALVTQCDDAPSVAEAPPSVARPAHRERRPCSHSRP